MLTIVYKMRNNRGRNREPWTEFAGNFDSWEAFTKFVIRENLMYGRQVVDPYEAEQPRYTVGKNILSDLGVFKDGVIIAYFPTTEGEKLAKEYAEWLNSKQEC